MISGLGLSNRVFTILSKMWSGLGYRVFSRTAHPAEIKKRIESKEWKITHQGRTSKDNDKNYKRATNRLTLGTEFIGEPMNYEDAKLLCSR